MHWLIMTAEKPAQSMKQRLYELFKTPDPYSKYDSFRAGEIFEHSWHIIFSGNVKEEMDALDCYEG